MALPRFKVAVLLACLGLAAIFALPVLAHAENLEQLGYNYTAAVRGYEDALAEQEQNAQEIAAIELQLEATNNATERTRSELGETVASLYKVKRSQAVVLDLVLGSESLSDALQTIDRYEQVERYCKTRIEQLRAVKAEQDAQRAELEERKNALETKVADAKQAADDAQEALLNASHVDGAEFHQRQGNGSNCGATAFIMGVNALLHDNRFTDNVEVWSSPSFNSDSTTALVSKGRAWLADNDLADTIGMNYVPGDIHTTDELLKQLNEGYVVVMSSGPGSIWQRADGTETEPDAFPDGHYALFYRCEGGIFFCNDSSVEADRGAGCPYTEEQMQQWLDGRENHYAAVLFVK